VKLDAAAREEHGVEPPARFFLAMAQAVVGTRRCRPRKRGRRRPYWPGMRCGGWTRLLRRRCRSGRERDAGDAAGHRGAVAADE
jgi:hypothetical protein